MAFLFEKRENSVQITGFDGEVTYLNIPEEVDGLPVTSVAGHAFSGRQDIREIVVPETVTELRSFAFYDCRNLRKLTLSDSVVDYYDGVIRECIALKEIDLTIRAGKYQILKDLTGDSPEEMHFRITVCGSDNSGNSGSTHEDGHVVFLTFPSYHNEDREDTHARAIHPKIVGAGYHYRQCMNRQGIFFREYDRIFSKAETDGIRTASQIAFDRLRSPVELTEDAKVMYADYLHEKAAVILDDLIEENDRDLLEYLLYDAYPDLETVQTALKLASRRKRTEICGMLMEYQNRFKKEGNRSERENDAERSEQVNDAERSEKLSNAAQSDGSAHGGGQSYSDRGDQPNPSNYECRSNRKDGENQSKIKEDTSYKGMTFSLDDL
ncbi:MAG: leucine-rich repeat domain-containing protein [Eubacterium sp.]|nr:leucine-rich repeat domain-containing protein [Eubacterium sp.]